MLKIRLQRVGRKHDPKFRLVLTDSHNGPKSGKSIKVLGWFDARLGKKEFNVEEIQHYISKGAQTSDTVHNILVSDSVINGRKVNALPRRTPIKTEGTPEKPEINTKDKPASEEAPIAPETDGKTTEEAPAPTADVVEEK